MEEKIINRQVASHLFFLIIFQFVKEENEKYNLQKSSNYVSDYLHYKDFTSATIEEFQNLALSEFVTSTNLAPVHLSILNGQSVILTNLVNSFLALETININEKHIAIFLNYISNNENAIVDNLLKKFNLKPSQKKHYNSTEDITLFTTYYHHTKMNTYRWSIDQNQYKFPGERYWLYYYDELHEYKEKKSLDYVVTDIGVSKALLIFENFGQASIISYNVKTNQTEIYRGNYTIYNKAYLYMNFDIFPTFVKDLHSLMFIGRSGEYNFAVGQFHNLDVTEKIYSGSIVIKHIKEELKDIQNILSEKDWYSNAFSEKISKYVRFFSRNDENTPSDLTEEIKTFLSDANLNYIYVPNVEIKTDRQLRFLRK